MGALKRSAPTGFGGSYANAYLSPAIVVPRTLTPIPGEAPKRAGTPSQAIEESLTHVVAVQGRPPTDATGLESDMPKFRPMIVSCAAPSRRVRLKESRPCRQPLPDSNQRPNGNSG